MTACNSIRLFVVCGSPPLSSTSDPLAGWRRMYAQPPGPGFPEQAPSVYNSTRAFCVMPASLAAARPAAPI